MFKYFSSSSEDSETQQRLEGQILEILPGQVLVTQSYNLEDVPWSPAFSNRVTLTSARERNWKYAVKGPALFFWLEKSVPPYSCKISLALRMTSWLSNTGVHKMPISNNQQSHRENLFYWFSSVTLFKQMSDMRSQTIKWISYEYTVFPKKGNRGTSG